ncbi:inhibitor of KinA [Hasllibacter halocynthiae]|uniref:Inhibitor of KinA n=2 Tax=Hasllibacter halocynthiae TaxID=595589 RepID=A0A2T0X2Q0_9RHOB|nr:inhibitor of KinA [Hasllibacter halocynthiae]
MGERGLLLTFGADAEDRAAREAVRAADAALGAAAPGWLLEAVPSYVALLIVFDPLATDHEGVAAFIDAMAPAGGRAPAPKEWEIPFCPANGYAPDLSEVAARTGLAEEEVIATFCAATFEVAMLGFAPGYAYLAGLPEALRLPRKSAPVPSVARGSVIVAGAQALVMTLDLPAGWWRIGRSPMKLLLPEAEGVSPLSPGDAVRFRAIPAAEMPS